MVDMRADDTPELQAWRQEVRDFLAEALPEPWTFWYDYDEDPESWERYLTFWRKVAEKRWVSLTWPKEYYGLGRSAIEKWILDEEFVAHDVPTYPVIGRQVSELLMRHGTHEQRLKHLKGIADVSVLWGEGYSEPGAGSDLAGLTTKAHRDGNEWVINGQKTLGTAAHVCQWMSVLARTDPDGPRHAGLSCFLVPLDTPGVEMLPLNNMADGRQNMTYFDDVRIPAENLVGDENQAWTQVWFGMGGDKLDNALPGTDPHTLRIIPLFARVLRYCQQTNRGGQRLADDPLIRQQLGELMVGVETLKVQAFENYSRAQTRKPSKFGAASSHLSAAFHKEFWPHLAQVCMEIVGPMAQLKGGRWAQLNGELEHYFRASFGNHAGGTSQLKRMVLATRGLGLPR